MIPITGCIFKLLHQMKLYIVTYMQLVHGELHDCSKYIPLTHTDHDIVH